MAKRIQLNNRFGTAWATHKCEEYVVVDAYLRIKPYAGTDSRLALFEMDWMDGGKMLIDPSLIFLNDHLRRKGHPVIKFVDSHSDSYSVLREGKSQERWKIRDELEAMSASDRSILIDMKLREAQSLNERNYLADAKRELARSERVKVPVTPFGDALKGLSERIKEGAPTSTLATPAPTPDPAVPPQPRILEPVVRPSETLTVKRTRMRTPPLAIYVLTNVKMRADETEAVCERFGISKWTAYNVRRRYDDNHAQTVLVARDHASHLEPAIARLDGMFRVRAELIKLRPPAPEPTQTAAPIIIPSKVEEVRHINEMEIIMPTEQKSDSALIERLTSELRSLRAEVAELKSIMLRQ